MDFVKGQLVRSKAGRDRTHLFAVMAVEGQMLFLADGHLHKLFCAKHKKKMHVAPTATVLQGEFLANDEKLREAIEQYVASSQRTEGGKELV